MTTTYRITLPRVDAETAAPEARELLEAARKQTGRIPNMYAFMANAPGALATYRFGYERFRKGSGFTPAEQEVVFLAISVENGCEYCVAAHSALADGPSRVPRDVTEAIRNRTEVPDPKLRALAALAQAMVAKRGRPSPEDVQAFLDARYAERQVLELVLAVAVKTISNYTNHLFDTPVDSPFESRRWKAA